MRAPIWLKFGTCIGDLKANTRIEFGVVMSDFMHKAESNFCHAYMVNRYEEKAENRYVARLNIRRVPFGG